MKKVATTPLSILDLVTYADGTPLADAFRNSRKLAQSAERWGYRRYWVAEHHNLEGIASSATVVLMGYLAEATKTIRIGSGGIMLPNHAPFIVAEQVGTLESIYPGRIDLGLGRAPGTDPLTMRALRRHSTGADFDREVRLERRDHVQVERAVDVHLHLFQHQIHHRGQVHAMLAGTRVAPP